MMTQANPRIEPIDAELKEPLKSKMAEIFPLPMPSPTLYRTVAKNESLFIDLIDMKLLGPTGLLDRRKFPPRLREITILRTCVTAKNWYEFNLHITTISEMMGLSKDQINNICSKELDTILWDESEIVLMELIDSLVSQLEVSDELFLKLSEYYSESQIVELLMLTGLYTTVSMIVAVARPELDNYRLQ